MYNVQDTFTNTRHNTFIVLLCRRRQNSIMSAIGNKFLSDWEFQVCTYFTIIDSFFYITEVVLVVIIIIIIIIINYYMIIVITICYQY